MIAAIESAAARPPKSGRTEAALFLGGNYYWVQLDRDRAAGYYKRLADNFPSSADATPPNGASAWAAMLKRQPRRRRTARRASRRFPGSAFASDALYWLGRLAEEAENAIAGPRLLLESCRSRFPQNYFTQRHRALPRDRPRSGDPDAAAFSRRFRLCPPRSRSAPRFLPPPPTRQARADALRSIAFDASAELELARRLRRHRRAALAARSRAGSRRMPATSASRSSPSARFIRSSSGGRFADVPREVWLAAYAMPFQPSIRIAHSAHVGLDPMLTAGLIRQESAYHARSAFRRQRLRPDAAAAENRAAFRQAGARSATPPPCSSSRITIFTSARFILPVCAAILAAWNPRWPRTMPAKSASRSGPPARSYREPAEFVDSIPFTETREYVEIVTRNAEIYRKLYGAGKPMNPLAKPSASRGGN